MKTALLISINPKWAEKILNGEKTIEIRTWIPKDYAGWVYVALTQGKLYICREIGDCLQSEKLNGKVAFRFWFEKADKIIRGGMGFIIENQDQRYTNGVARDSCLDFQDLVALLKDKVGYAWHIDKLEIFDKPKELSEFYRGYDILGNEPKPYLTHQITKAPQKCAWVYTNDQPQLREPKVLDEETPSKKDESERKPF